MLTVATSIVSAEHAHSGQYIHKHDGHHTEVTVKDHHGHHHYDFYVSLRTFLYSVSTFGTSNDNTSTDSS